MRKRFRSAIAKAILFCCCLMAGGVAYAQVDTTVPVRVKTIGLSLIGTTWGGVGLTYEQSFSRYLYSDSVKSYAYWRGAVGYPDLYGGALFPSLGAGYCHAISHNRKYFVGAGLNVGVQIAFNPTPKELRDYWDSIGFYGGNYIYPTELFIIPEISLGYLGKRWFLKVQFTPLMPYERWGRNEFRFVPWGGISTGIRLK